MKILFVSSGNRIGLSPIVKNQGDSLKTKGVEVVYYTIDEKGVLGYLKNIKKLKLAIQKERPDHVHAHFSFCGFVASLAKARPLTVSLMGSDVKVGPCQKAFVKFFIRFLWSNTIVKSQDMNNSLALTTPLIIPNGVSLVRFKPMDQTACIKKLGWDTQKKHILFMASKKKEVKNYPLASAAIAYLSDKNNELHTLENIANKDIPTYLNASHTTLLCSKWEGSPNAIKEAMACNKTIVSTNVGDVEWLFGDIKGVFLSQDNPKDIAKKIQKALALNSSEGRERILNLQLDSDSISKKLLEVYNNSNQ